MPFKLQNILSKKSSSQNIASPIDVQNETIRAYFDHACQIFGANIQSVGWYSRATQSARFKVLSQIAELNNESILDVGCGHGDLWQFLSQNQIQCKYTGIDLSAKMIAIARSKYKATSFQQCDFFSTQFEQSFDYILTSGALNYRMQDPQKYILHTIEKMFRLANKGIAFNLLSIYAPSEQKDVKTFCYYDPAEVVDLCFRFSKNVVLNHNYLPNDFSIYLYK